MDERSHVHETHRYSIAIATGKRHDELVSNALRERTLELVHYRGQVPATARTLVHTRVAILSMKPER